MIPRALDSIIGSQPKGHYNKWVYVFIVTWTAEFTTSAESKHQDTSLIILRLDRFQALDNFDLSHKAITFNRLFTNEQIFESAASS